MKRIHLFEIEDQAWFPNWLRICLTRLIVVMHKLFKTKDQLSELVAKALKESKHDTIIDLCSGSGGPMPEVLDELDSKYGFKNLKLMLSDLYPNTKAVKKYQEDGNDKISYLAEPVDVTNINSELQGLHTIICGFHHMPPKVAKQILQSAHEKKQALLIYEISDNSPPLFALIIAFPINFIMCLFVTLGVRPMTWQQLVFTYLIPIIPLAFAWDGAVSNARTYTLKDMDELLEGLHTDDYHWEKGALKGNPKKLYLIGMPA